MNRNNYGGHAPEIRDYGAEPLIVNIDCFAQQNPYYRTALWTGNHLQVTLMSIPVHGDIGLEMHSHLDQFIRIEDGYALVMMGNSQTNLNHRQRVNGNYAVLVPAGTWHNIINIGKTPLKLYSIYAPPQHPFGPVHKTKMEEKSRISYYMKCGTSYIFSWKLRFSTRPLPLA